MIKLYTIGFTKKTARQFFELLINNNVKKLVDVRINNASQLAGFAKGADLEYFANTICGIRYEFIADFAPTKELLSDYQNKKIDWEDYKRIYRSLIEARKVTETYNLVEFDHACFLCSEPTAEQCHRGLLVEYFWEIDSEIQIVHL